MHLGEQLDNKSNNCAGNDIECGGTVDQANFQDVERIVNEIECGVMVVDQHLRVLVWNAWLADKSGISADSILQHSFDILSGVSGVKRLVMAIEQAIAHNLASKLSTALNPCIFPVYATQDDRIANQRIKQSISVQPLITLEHGTCCLVFIRDVSDSVKREQVLRRKSDELQQKSDQLEAEESVNRAIMNNIADGVMTFDSQGVLAQFNPAAAELIAQDLTVDMNRFQHIFAPQCESSADFSEFISSQDLLGDDGEVIWKELEDRVVKTGLAVEASLVKITLASSLIYTLVLRDITIRKRTEQELNELAHFDSLTGLANRLLLMDRLEQAMQRAQRQGDKVGFMLFDIDHFKQVNDTMGHCVGDKLLKEIAARLKLAVRKEDTVARLGGDEFCLLLEHIHSDADLIGLAQKLIEALNKSMLIEGHQLKVSASIGIVNASADLSIESMIKQADIAMYNAKEKGRNRFQFYHEKLTLITCTS